MRFNPDTNPDEQFLTGDSSAIKSIETLPAVEVKNKVIWVNSKARAPFRLEKGRQAQLGMFLTSDPEDHKTYPLEIMDKHYRSALVGKVIFEDDEGRLYRDVDLKGAGGVSRDYRAPKLAQALYVDPLTPYRVQSGDAPYGICDLGYAITDRKMSEYFVKKGLRTHRALAFIKLEELIVERGKKISVKDAYRLNYIKKDIEPVIEVRAFGMKARIANSLDAALLKDAKAMVAQELGKSPDNFSDREYMTWFAETLGKQIAVIHSAGYWHNYLTEHNITLDCRIVDLDSVNKLPKTDSIIRRKIKKDLEYTIGSLKSLYYAFGSKGFDPGDTDYLSHVEVNKLFYASYLKNMTNTKLKKIIQNHISEDGIVYTMP